MFDKLKLLFSSQELSDKEFEEFFLILERLPEEEKKELFIFLSEHPEWVSKICINYKQKKKTALNKDAKQWEKLLKQEEKDLNNFL